MIYVKDNVERIVDNAADAKRLEHLGYTLKKPAKKPVVQGPKTEPEKPVQKQRRKRAK